MTEAMFDLLMIIETVVRSILMIFLIIGITVWIKRK